MHVMSENLTHLIAALGVLALAHGAIALVVVRALRIAAKERDRLKGELLGLVKKIDHLTASGREQMLTHYDAMLGDLSRRLPESIAAETGQKIFDTESRIISRLAELEPDLRTDAEGRAKMNELIESMESLESSVVQIAADSVKRAIDDGRRSLAQTIEIPPLPGAGRLS